MRKNTEFYKNQVLNTYPSAILIKLSEKEFGTTWKYAVSITGDENSYRCGTEADTPMLSWERAFENFQKIEEKHSCPSCGESSYRLRKVGIGLAYRCGRCDRFFRIY